MSDEAVGACSRSCGPASANPSHAARTPQRAERQSATPDIALLSSPTSRNAGPERATTASALAAAPASLCLCHEAVAQTTPEPGASIGRWDNTYRNPRLHPVHWDRDSDVGTVRPAPPTVTVTVAFCRLCATASHGCGSRLNRVDVTASSRGIVRSPHKRLRTDDRLVGAPCSPADVTQTLGYGRSCCYRNGTSDGRDG